MGVEKKNKQDRLQEGDELNSTFSLRPQGLEIDHTGVCCSESCKDIDVVSVAPQCLTSTAAESLATGMDTDHTLKDQPFFNSRIMFQGDSSLDYDSGLDSITAPSSVFEFQRAERGLQRAGLAPFSRAASSKWDDAQKWIASPITNRMTNRQPHVEGGVVLRKDNQFGSGNRQTSLKFVLEIQDQMLVPYEESNTKRMELSQEFKETGWPKPVEWRDNLYRSTDSYNNTVTTTENFVKQSATRSVSMRDMGTEMTPIASQEPSRTGTPVRATTPIRSPTLSQPSTPRRASLSPYHPNVSDHNKKELSEKQMQIKTRREIMLLGTQLGRMNIAAWASKEEEDADGFTLQNNLGLEKQPKSLMETRAAAWEEAEKAKCMARFKQEDIKIHAWENREIAKNEAEMRKVEVQVDRMSSRAHDKLMNKLAAVRLKAEEKRAAAESERNRQGAKTEKQADHIRRTGQIPPSFSCCGLLRF